MDWNEFGRWEWLLQGLVLVLAVVELVRTRRLIRRGREEEALAEAARKRDEASAPDS